MAIPQTPNSAKKNGNSENTDEGGAGTSAVKLGPGDRVEFTVYGVPELTTKARVSNDGDLYLPLIDYAHVGGP